MNQYFFILGKTPTLSLSEIITTFNAFQLNYSLTHFSPEAAIFSLESNIDQLPLMKILGGTVKFGVIMQESEYVKDQNEFDHIFQVKELIKFLPTEAGKIHIGISLYDVGTNKHYLDLFTTKLKALNISLKEGLTEEGLKVGFPQIKGRFLSSVSVAKNRLLTKGAEVVLLLTSNKVIIGKTLAVQEFQQFSFRDYGRPQRDKRAGIMPPKLARIMINLASVKKDQVILDPFCGSGTVLQEAILLDYQHLYGSDISNQAIENTETNLAWLFENFPRLNRDLYKITIKNIDVNQISKYLPQNTIEAIVTEPYLGPPLFRKPDEGFVRKIMTDLSKLYLSAFSEFARLLKNNGIVIIIFPAFEVNDQIYFLEIMEKIKSLGFKQKDFFPPELKNNFHLQLTKRETILFGSAEQFLRREIISFQKQ